MFAHKCWDIMKQAILSNSFGTSGKDQHFKVNTGFSLCACSMLTSEEHINPLFYLKMHQTNEQCLGPCNPAISWIHCTILPRSNKPVAQPKASEQWIQVQKNIRYTYFAHSTHRNHSEAFGGQPQNLFEKYVRCSTHRWQTNQWTFHDFWSRVVNFPSLWRTK